MSWEVTACFALRLEVEIFLYFYSNRKGSTWISDLRRSCRTKTEPWIHLIYELLWDCCIQPFIFLIEHELNWKWNEFLEYLMLKCWSNIVWNLGVRLAGLNAQCRGCNFKPLTKKVKQLRMLTERLIDKFFKTFYHNY